MGGPKGYVRLGVSGKQHAWVSGHPTGLEAGTDGPLLGSPSCGAGQEDRVSFPFYSLAMPEYFQKGCRALSAGITLQKSIHPACCLD